MIACNNCFLADSAGKRCKLDYSYGREHCEQQVPKELVAECVSGCVAELEAALGVPCLKLPEGTRIGRKYDWGGNPIKGSEEKKDV